MGVCLNCATSVKLRDATVTLCCMPEHRVSDLIMRVVMLLAFAASCGALTLPGMQQRVHTRPLLSESSKGATKVLRVRGGSAAMSSIWTSNFFPIVGSFTSSALYFSPIPAVMERIKAGSLGDLSEPARMGTIDAFVSHCEATQRLQPWTALHASAR